jgi:hypothetical protein
VTSHHTGLKEVSTITLEDTMVKAIQYVPGLHGGVPSPDGEPLKGDLVWVGTDSRRYLHNSTGCVFRCTSKDFFATLKSHITAI